MKSKLFISKLLLGTGIAITPITLGSFAIVNATSTLGSTSSAYSPLPGTDTKYEGYFYPTQKNGTGSPININFGTASDMNSDTFNIETLRVRFTVKNIEYFKFTDISTCSVYELVKNNIIDSVYVDAVANSATTAYFIFYNNGQATRYNVDFSSSIFRNKDGSITISNADFTNPKVSGMQKYSGGQVEVSMLEKPNGDQSEDRSIFAGMSIHAIADGSNYYLRPYWTFDGNNSFEVRLHSLDNAVNELYSVTSSSATPILNSSYNEVAYDYNGNSTTSGLLANNLNVPINYLDPNKFFVFDKKSNYNSTTGLDYLYLTINEEYLSSALLSWDSVVNQAPCCGSTLTGTWSTSWGNEVSSFYSKHIKEGGSQGDDILTAISNGIINGKLIFPSLSTVLNWQVPKSTKILNTQYSTLPTDNDIVNFIHTHYNETDVSVINNAINNLTTLSWKLSIASTTTDTGKFKIANNYTSSGTDAWLIGRSTNLSSVLYNVLDNSYDYDITIDSTAGVNIDSLHYTYSAHDIYDGNVSIIFSGATYQTGHSGVTIKSFKSKNGSLGSFISSDNYHIGCGTASSGTYRSINPTDTCSSTNRTYYFSQPQDETFISFIGSSYGGNDLLYYGWSLDNNINNIPIDSALWRSFGEFIYSRKPSEIAAALNKGTYTSLNKTSQIDFIDIYNNNVVKKIRFDANNFIAVFDGTTSQKLPLEDYIALEGEKLKIDWKGDDSTGVLTAAVYLKKNPSVPLYYTTNFWAKNITLTPKVYKAAEKYTCKASEFADKYLNGYSTNFLKNCIQWYDSASSSSYPRLFTSTMSYSDFKYNLTTDGIDPTPYTNDYEGSLTLNVLATSRVFSTSDYVHLPLASKWRTSTDVLGNTHLVYKVYAFVPVEETVYVPSSGGSNIVPVAGLSVGVIVAIVIGCVVFASGLLMYGIHHHQVVKMKKEDAEEEAELKKKQASDPSKAMPPQI